MCVVQERRETDLKAPNLGKCCSGEPRIKYYSQPFRRKIPCLKVVSSGLRELLLKKAFRHQKNWCDKIEM